MYVLSLGFSVPLVASGEIISSPPAAPAVIISNFFVLIWQTVFLLCPVGQQTTPERLTVYGEDAGTLLTEVFSYPRSLVFYPLL
jgi:hypothetical protein